MKKQIRINSNSLFNEAEITADLKVEEPTLETISYNRRKNDLDAINQLLPWSQTIPPECRIPNKFK